MELSTWSNMIVGSTNGAKILMNTMLGYVYGEKPQEHQAMVLALYESLPADTKKDKKEFAAFFTNFFEKFDIDEQNIKYYDEFYPFFNATQKAQVLKSNKHIKQKVEFKNTLEFVRFVLKSSPNEMINIIEDNKDYLQSLKAKDKEKLIANCDKQQYGKVWSILIERDYVLFKNFCEYIDINPTEQLKKIVAESEHEMNYLCVHRLPGSIYQSFKKDEKAQINAFLADIQAYGYEKFFETDKFNSFIADSRSKTKNNALFTTMELLLTDKTVLAVSLIKAFPTELQAQIKKEELSKTDINLYDINDWVSVLEKFNYYNPKLLPSHAKFGPFFVKRLKDKGNSDLKAILIEDNLSKNLPKQPDNVKPLKI